MTIEDIVSLLQLVLGDGPWPKGLHLLRAICLVRSGVPLRQAASEMRTTVRKLAHSAASDDPVAECLGLTVFDLTHSDLSRTRLLLAQLVVGRCAEAVFEEIYREALRTHDLEIRDLRESRSDTDYRVYNGSGRPVYRLNIKFHGSRFRRAPELVGLEPDDCFALATYKIYSALQKEKNEELPYIFVVVDAPGLSAEVVGSRLPDDLVTVLALLTRSRYVTCKRDVEDRAVSYLVESDHAAYVETHACLQAARWYVLSARKAYELLRETLYERVFALRVRGFARQFRGAELDMHFSLSRDLTPLPLFLDRVREEGQTKVAVMMTKGLI